MRTRNCVFRFLAVLAAAWALILLVDVGLVSASTASATGNWIDLTLYCGSGVCVPYGTNHKSHAEVNYYSAGKDEPYHAVYWQDFGGSLFPKSSFCGNYDWLKGATWYVTSTGNVTITGWWSTGAWCSTGTLCKNYYSDKDYNFNCTNGSCKGKFKSATWFTNRCVPNLISHTTTVSF